MGILTMTLHAPNFSNTFELDVSEENCDRKLLIF